jgi:hypothetical protein
MDRLRLQLSWPLPQRMQCGADPGCWGSPSLTTLRRTWETRDTSRKVDAIVAVCKYRDRTTRLDECFLGFLDCVSAENLQAKIISCVRRNLCSGALARNKHETAWYLRHQGSPGRFHPSIISALLSASARYADFDSPRGFPSAWHQLPIAYRASC